MEPLKKPKIEVKKRVSIRQQVDFFPLDIEPEEISKIWDKKIDLPTQRTASFNWDFLIFTRVCQAAIRIFQPRFR